MNQNFKNNCMTFITITITILFITTIPTSNALDNGVGRTPPLGWNSWETCGEKTCGHDICNETEIKSVALGMKSNGMYDLGYNYVNLDDCWAYPRDTKTQQLTWDPSRFPDGLPNLISWLHKEGFKFGLYTSAGNVTCSSGGRPMPIPGSKGHYELDAKHLQNGKLIM